MLKTHQYVLTILILLVSSLNAYAYKSEDLENFELTNEELAWIKSNPEVKFTGDPNWLPYEAFQEDGSYIGIVADHLKLVEKRTGLKFKPIPVSDWSESLKIATEGQVSVISGDAADDILNRQFNPIEAYSQNPIVIIMRSQQNYVERLDEIKDKRIVIIKDYGYTADIYKFYPDYKFIEVENIQEGLSGVADGQFDAMLATMALASYTMAEMGVHNIKVVGKTQIVMDLTLFISKDIPILHSIVNKAMKMVSVQESQNISQKWKEDTYVEKVDYSIAIQVSVIFVTLLLLSLYWNRKLKTEISSRLKAEQRLSKIASRLPGMIYQFELYPDGSTALPYTSTAVKDIYGVEPDEVIQDASKLFDKHHPDDADRIASSIAESARTFSPWNIKYRLKLSDGSTRWLYGSSIPEKTAKGSILWSGFITDITEQVNADEEHARLQRELHQSQKMDALGNLTGGIAHDFNNILGIIMGNVSLAQLDTAKVDSDNLNRHLETIQTASERARDLVAQMMVFSHSEQGEQHPLELTPLVKADIKMLQSLLPTSIDVKLDYQKSLPKVMMNPVKLQQILMNICVNAKDAMNGVGTLTINLGMCININQECTTCHEHLTGDWLELTVSDTGVGMDVDTITHIFEPFYTTKEVGKGTGMGLAVVDSTVKSLNGHLIVESEVGKGTTFRILFPPVQFNELVAPDESTQYVTSKGNGKSILIVDDEPDLANIASEILMANGYQATAIASSTEALKLFESNPTKFDLVITDQTMPDLTGIELANKIRGIRPEMPIILVTGYSETIDQKKAEHQGIGFLRKPVTTETITKQVAEILRKA